MIRGKWLNQVANRFPHSITNVRYENDYKNFQWKTCQQQL